MCACVCVEEGGISPGGSGGVSVTQSSCDRCQAHENGVREQEQERRRGEMKGRKHEEEKSSILSLT